MAAIVTQTADNAYRIRDVFRAANRDNYPLGVYQALYDHITVGEDEAYGEGEAYHLSDLDSLDIIAWCCDPRETTLDTLDTLAARSCVDYPVLYVDEDAKTVYHLAYYS